MRLLFGLLAQNGVGGGLEGLTVALGKVSTDVGTAIANVAKALPDLSGWAQSVASKIGRA